VKSLLTLNPYFIRYKYYLLLGVGFVVLTNLFAIYPAQMVRSSFDLVAQNIDKIDDLKDPAERNAFLDVMEASVLKYGLLIVAMALLRGLFLFFMRQTIIVMSRHIEFDQKNDIYEQYQNLPLSFYRRNNTGDLMARISEDVSRVRMYTGPAIMYSINLLVLFVMVISYMISVNPEFTMYVLLPLPILSISVYFINTEIEKRSDLIQKSLSNLSTFVQEAFSGIRVIKAYGREQDSADRFAEESNEYRHRSIQLGNVNAWFSPLILSLIGISTILTVYVGGQQAIQGKVSTGNIAEFLIYVNMLTWPVTSLGWVISIAQRAAVSQTRINEFLDNKSEIVSIENRETPIRGVIEFQNVSFTYPDTGIEALKNVSFKASPGQSIGILGNTGCGKSTLANLVVRLFDAGSGQVLIDGQPIQSWNPRILRKQMSYVQQDVFLFSDTIRNNILFGNPELSEAEMRHASFQSDLLDNVEGFEKKFDTMIGERGITLSGGQKQRVSIARALVLKPRVLILDDCLSAVDTRTENTILSHLKEEMKDKTTLIISHRISSVNLADTILVMEEGRIVQSGNHDELIKVEGPYKALYEKQLVSEETGSDS
jgi:ATP-binding cassette, subfamily B, multidrug efflux pump